MHVQNIEERENICKKCAIYSPIKGQCNSQLWINPSTNDASSRPKAGYIRGCGCILKFKWGNPSNHCIAGKW